MGQRHPAQREAVIDAVEIEPVGTANHEAQILTALASLLQESAEGDRVELVSGAVQEGHESARWEPPSHLLILANLDQFHAGVTGQELLIVLDVIGERRPQATHGDDDDSHG
jgi:hypothetical protein